MGNREKPGSTPKASCKTGALVPVVRVGPSVALAGVCEPITPALLLRRMSVVTVLLLLP